MARRRIWNCRKLVITQIHGYCLGGAHDIALSCDFVVASEDTVMGVPEIQFGMGAAFLAMPYMIHLRKAKELLLTGQKYTAKEGMEYGLVNYAVPASQLEETVKKLAKELAVISTPAMELQKASNK